MRKVSWLVMGLFAVAAAWCFAVSAQAQQGPSQGGFAGPTRIAQLPPGGPGGQGGPGAMSPAQMEKMRQQMLERMLDQSGLSDNEKAAAKQALEVKQQARTALEDQLTKLRRVANKSNPTDQEMNGALATYRAAMDEYRAKVEAADAVLIKALSLKGQLRCMSLGILDNGLGSMGPGAGGPGGGTPGQGGPGGGPGGGQGQGPGFGPPPAGFGPPG